MLGIARHCTAIGCLGRIAHPQPTLYKTWEIAADVAPHSSTHHQLPSALPCSLTNTLFLSAGSKKKMRPLAIHSTYAPTLPRISLSILISDPFDRSIPRLTRPGAFGSIPTRIQNFSKHTQKSERNSISILSVARTRTSPRLILRQANDVIPIAGANHLRPNHLPRASLDLPVNSSSVQAGRVQAGPAIVAHWGPSKTRFSEPKRNARRTS